jgi:hypothetical protein|tara:strand:+ start:96 stop:800 length:705 start_codon:yes stop_codon:yes gene_type:complete
MARIKTYSNDTVVVANDKWIGSDSQAKFATKNYTAQSVADFINEKGNQLQSLRYKYKSTPPRNPGTISFSPYKANNVPFSTITSWILSDSELKSPEDISTFYTSPLIGSDVLVTQCDDITQWAIYEWDSVTDVPNEKLFSNIGLSYRTGLGGLINDEDYFISLLSYQGGGDLNFTYVQGVASTTWNIQHNLGKFPSITVIDTANTVVTGEYTYDDINNVTLTFSAAFAGTAYLN